ncbi:MAG: kinase [Pseudomonadota bacterium]|nr:kinase [Pseudomonadota bacterium]
MLSSTIDKYCYITCRYLPPFFEHKYRVVYSEIENAQSVDEIRHPAVRGVLNFSNIKTGLEIHHDGDLPSRSGLGSSSAFTVGLLHAVNALEGKMISRKQLAMDAMEVEQHVIKEAVGSQDQVATAYGGLNTIVFNQDGSFSVSPVIIAQDRKNLLNDHLMLFFTGITRFAPDLEVKKIENLNRNANDFNEMGAMVDEGIKILVNPRADMLDFGRLLHESWQIKRHLVDGVSNDLIDTIYATGISNGAVGGKILGAGGGGFLALFAAPDKQTAIKEALSDFLYVAFRFESEGSAICVYQPDGF